MGGMKTTARQANNRSVPAPLSPFLLPAAFSFRFGNWNLLYVEQQRRCPLSSNAIRNSRRKFAEFFRISMCCLCLQFAWIFNLTLEKDLSGHQQQFRFECLKSFHCSEREAFIIHRFKVEKCENEIWICWRLFDNSLCVLWNHLVWKTEPVRQVFLCVWHWNQIVNCYN